jgi:hypothetical protein
MNRWELVFFQTSTGVSTEDVTMSYVTIFRPRAGRRKCRSLKYGHALQWTCHNDQGKLAIGINRLKKGKIQCVYVFYLILANKPWRFNLRRTHDLE